MKNKNLFRSKLEVAPYENTNETINGLLEDGDTLWIVQGPAGRSPILADTADQAIENYITKYWREDA